MINHLKELPDHYIKWHVCMVIQGFLDIIDGLVKIFSLGYFGTDFGITWICYCCEVELSKPHNPSLKADKRESCQEDIINMPVVKRVKCKIGKMTPLAP